MSAADAFEPQAARRYSWEPFTPGHTKSLKHGAWSPRRVDPLATELLDAVIADASAPGSSIVYLTEPAYRPALVAWARVEARVQLVSTWLADHEGDIDDEGNVRPAADLLTKLDAQALKHRERLGLDPLARARLGRDVAASSADIAQLLTRLNEMEGTDDDD